MTRKQALIIIGTWMTCALGKWTRAEEAVHSDLSKKGEVLYNWPPPNTTTLSYDFFKMDLVKFNLGAYKKVVLQYENETIEYTTKELFEALKK